MNPGGSPDNNLVSFYSTHSGEPGKPMVYNFDVLDASVPDRDGKPYTGAVKVTDQAHDIVINVGRIIGGKETHYDFNNRAKRITLNVGEFVNKSSEYIGSIKGGCQDCWVIGPVSGEPPSKGAHHIDGNWSDQSDEITTGSMVGLRITDGSPTRYIQLNSRGVWTNNSHVNLRCVLFIPFGKRGIKVVWAVWRLLKKLKLA